MANYKVEIVSSLTIIIKKLLQINKEVKVFLKNQLKQLKRLNELGYGKENSGLIFNLVYNPVGAFLPPSQEDLEKDYKRELHKHFGVVFNNL